MQAEIDGGTIYYELAGDGPLVTLTHGIGGSAAEWTAVVPLLAERYRVLTYDGRGFGRSTKDPESEHSIERFARDLAGLLDHIGAAKAAVVGHSMGGTVVQRFLLDFPERAVAGVIMSTSSKVNEKGRDYWDGQAAFIEEHGMRAWTERNRAPHITAEYLRDHPEVREAEERRIAMNDPRVYGKVARVVARYDYTDELPRVAVPTLVMVGSADTQTPPGGSVIISRAIPGATLHILDGLGHGLPREAPEKVAALLLPFLDALPPTAEWGG